MKISISQVSESAGKRMSTFPVRGPMRLELEAYFNAVRPKDHAIGNTGEDKIFGDALNKYKLGMTIEPDAGGHPSMTQVAIYGTKQNIKKFLEEIYFDGLDDEDKQNYLNDIAKA